MRSSGERGRRLATFVLAGLLLLSLGLSLRHLTAAYPAAGRGVERVAGLARAAAIEPNNWSFHRDLALFAKAAGDFATASRHYARAIAAYPGCARCWIGLAETRVAAGGDPRAAVEKAVRHGKSITTVRIRAGVVYSRLGDAEASAREFGASISGHRYDKHALFALVHRLFEPDFILEKVVRDRDLRSYFHFAQRALAPDEMAVVWQRYSTQEGAADDRESYVRYLIGQGRVHEAYRLDRPTPADAASLGRVADGGFEHSLSAGVFTWRIEDAPGVTARLVACNDCAVGRRALRIAFDGETNVRYGGVEQLVPARGGRRHVLTARIKKVAITSERGPVLAVRGVGDEAAGCELKEETGEFRLSSGWAPVRLDFYLPEACEGVRVRVMRHETSRLNRFIGGELWLDDVALVESATAAEEIPQS